MKRRSADRTLGFLKLTDGLLLSVERVESTELNTQYCFTCAWSLTNNSTDYEKTYAYTGPQMGEACSIHGIKEKFIPICCRKAWRLFRRCELWWKDNIKIGVKDRVFENVDRIQMPQDMLPWRNLVNMIPEMNLRVSLKVRKFLD